MRESELVGFVLLVCVTAVPGERNQPTAAASVSSTQGRGEGCSSSLNISVHGTKARERRGGCANFFKGRGEGPVVASLTFSVYFFLSGQRRISLIGPRSGREDLDEKLDEHQSNCREKSSY
ncbi:uncharacterized protein BJX67DRAFT_239476 [Aspergillus lucknowensis]|uniref:Secreted protein n=1 Tax=Aspergillus lucknowensis TaxID=176173 RepID=A0ABR4LGE7_9EURO